MITINESEIVKAQEMLAEQIVSIGKAYLKNDNYRKIAEKMIDDLYGYQEGPVLFKPTKACEKQFRMTREGALSYFIGGNVQFPEDHGFALKPWKKLRFENEGYIIDKTHALTMGNYYFTDLNNNEIKVEFTIGYFISCGGNLKIHLHHSSLPYKP
jgi:hypothetical protein